MKTKNDTILCQWLDEGKFSLFGDIARHPVEDVYISTFVDQAGCQRRRVRLRTLKPFKIHGVTCDISGIMSYARVVCWQTHGNPPHGYVADHIDRDTMNDDPSNLRWLSVKENLQRHAPLSVHDRFQRDMNKFKAAVESAIGRILYLGEELVRSKECSDEENLAAMIETAAEISEELHLFTEKSFMARCSAGFHH